MRIRTISWLVGSIGFGLVAVGAVMAVSFYQQTTELIHHQRIAESISDTGFRLALLTSDVVLVQELRSERQWRQHVDKLKKIISDNRDVFSYQIKEIDLINKNTTALESIFNRTRARVEKLMGSGTHLHDDQIYMLLSSQLFIRVVELQTAIEEFNLSFWSSFEATIGSSKQGFIFKFSVLIIGYALFGLGTGVLFYTRVLSRISGLERSIQRIDGGETGHRPEKVVDDELGAVVESFIRFLNRQQLDEQKLEMKAWQLQSANREMETFVYVASHDLRAPLRGMDNLANWIAEDLGDALAGEVKENLDLLKSRIGRMEALLEGLLQYSRIGRRDAKVEAIDTGALVLDLVDLLSLPPGFEVVIPSTMPTVETQRPPLEMTFRNLISNAVKHHDRETGRVTLSCKKIGRFVEFTVSDDGPGIPREFSEKVFEMFQTLKPRDEVEGSGMGLALVKRTVEYHGGAIVLEKSKKGRGATFRFSWPLKPIEVSLKDGGDNSIFT